jgi:hypothetical protein
MAFIVHLEIGKVLNKRRIQIYLPASRQLHDGCGHKALGYGCGTENRIHRHRDFRFKALNAKPFGVDNFVAMHDSNRHAGDVPTSNDFLQNSVEFFFKQHVNSLHTAGRERPGYSHKAC